MTSQPIGTIIAADLSSLTLFESYTVSSATPVTLCRRHSTTFTQHLPVVRARYSHSVRSINGRNSENAVLEHIGTRTQNPRLKSTAAVATLLGRVILLRAPRWMRARPAHLISSAPSSILKSRYRPLQVLSSLTDNTRAATSTH